ncbi:hypothetical protein K8R43_03905 [archaeon]|nr:hypothetical protein [archaeon]
MMVTVSLVVLAFVWGSYQTEHLSEGPLIAQMETQMITIDNRMQEVSHGNTNFTMTLDLYYQKGVIIVNEEKDWIVYTANLLAGYPGEHEGTGLGETCNDSVYAIQDSETTVKMARMINTNVFRGSSGSSPGGAQMIETVICSDDIDVKANPMCVGRSGPRASMTLKKTGYNASTDKPIVEVGIC